MEANLSETSRRSSGENARDYALRCIKEGIVTLALEPGERISEADLALRFGISRTPVREALQELAKSQIVEILPQRGTYVALIDYTLVEEARFIRLVLEQAVLPLLCQQITSRGVYLLQQNLRQQQNCVQNSGDSARLFDLDNEFHRLLFALANKEHAFELMHNTLLHFDRVRSLSMTVTDVSRLVQDHKRLAEAIAVGNLQQAQQLMNEHLTRYTVDREQIRLRYPQYIR